jgi:hypothetical protein
MITTYDEYLNESLFHINRKELENTIKKVGEKIPQKLIDALNKSKEQIFPRLGKYVENGQLDLSKLSFLVSVNERYDYGYHDSKEWYTKEESDKAYNILKKVFGFPIYAIQLLVEFIKDVFEDGWFMGSLMVLLIAVLMALVSILGWYTVSAIEAHKNGLTVGDVITDVRYTAPYVTHQMVGKIPTTTYHPAMWHFQVKGIDKKGKERIEQWYTTDGKRAERVHPGQHISQEDFSWEGTVKK